MGKQWKQCQTLFWGAPNTADGDCSYEIKRHLLLGRKFMTNLDRIFKCRDIILLTKVRLIEAMVFSVVRYGWESWTRKKAEHWRIDAFELWCWRRLLWVPWTARRSNHSILKEISPGCSLEGMMLKLKLQYFATSCEELTDWRRLWCWEGLWVGGKGDDRGWDGWMASPTQWTWLVSKPRELVMDRKACGAAIHGVTKSRTWLSDWTELNWTVYNRIPNKDHILTSPGTSGSGWKRERELRTLLNHNENQKIWGSENRITFEGVGIIPSKRDWEAINVLNGDSWPSRPLCSQYFTLYIRVRKTLVGNQTGPSGNNER